MSKAIKSENFVIQHWFDSGNDIKVKGNGRGGYVNPIKAGIPRAISATEEAGTRTFVRLEIGAHLLHMPRIVELAEARLLFESRPKHWRVAAYNLRIKEAQELESISLTPDNRGRTASTIVTVELFKYVNTFNAVSELFKDADRRNKLALDVVQALTIDALSHVNEVLDNYVIASKNQAISRVSFMDTLQVEIWQLVGAETDGCNRLDTILPFGAACLINQIPTPDAGIMQAFQEQVNDYLAVDTAYKIAFRSISEAYRSFAAADYEMASVHATVACETASQHFYKSAKKSPNVPQTKKEACAEALRTAREVAKLQKGSLAILLIAAIPTLCVGLEGYNDGDIDLCDGVRRARNKALHDPLFFRAKGNQFPLRGQIEGVERYVRFLSSALLSFRAG